MRTKSTVVLFPGQGAYVPGCLHQWSNDARVMDLLSKVDGVAAEFSNYSVSKLLLDRDSPPINILLERDIIALQLAIYANTLAFGYLIADRLDVNTLLVGHSLGEITALTLAESWAIADGARIVVARVQAVEEEVNLKGGMFALEIGLERAENLIAASGCPDLAVAVSNSPRQTVISGKGESLSQLQKLAGILGVGCVRLASPFPFHNPLLHGAARRFLDKVKEITVRTPIRAVYSPIDGNNYNNSIDILERLANHFVHPVLFLDAVRKLYAWGSQEFIECGPTPALSNIVQQILPGVHPTTAGKICERPPSISSMNTDAFSCESSDDSHNSGNSTPTSAAPDDSGQAEAVEIAVKGDKDLIASLRSLYADWLEYPEDSITETADLEADLGIDSIKQTELLGRALQHFKAPGVSDDFRVDDFPTLQSVADYIEDRISSMAIV